MACDGCIRSEGGLVALEPEEGEEAPLAGSAHTGVIRRENAGGGGGSRRLVLATGGGDDRRDRAAPAVLELRGGHDTQEGVCVRSWAS